MKKNFFGLVLIAALIGAAPAQAGFDLGALVGLNFGNNTVSNAPAGSVLSTSRSSKAAFAFGVTGNYSLAPELSIELDVIHADTKSTYNAGSNIEATMTSKAWEIPIMARYWFVPMASIGVGPYFAFATGNINTSYSDGSADTTLEYNDPNFPTSKTDIGAIASVNIVYPIGNNLNVVGDARYLLGLKNLSGMTDAQKAAFGATDLSIKHRAFEILAGLSYAL